MAALATFERQTVEQFAREFERLFYARDVETLTAYYTEDAKIMVEDRPAIQGHTGIRQFWEAVCGMADTMTRSITVQECATSGDLGYLVSQVVVRVPTPDHHTIATTFKDVTVWRRERDGGWRIALDIANRNAPPAPERP